MERKKILRNSGWIKLQEKQVTSLSFIRLTNGFGHFLQTKQTSQESMI
jgi:hypothetical protein